MKADRIVAGGLIGAVLLLAGCSIEPWVKPYERERLADPSEAAVHEALLDVPHRDLEAGRGARLRDSGAHRPRPDHCDLSYLGQAHGTTRCRGISVRA